MIERLIEHFKNLSDTDSHYVAYVNKRLYTKAYSNSGKWAFKSVRLLLNLLSESIRFSSIILNLTESDFSNFPPKYYVVTNQPQAKLTPEGAAQIIKNLIKDDFIEIYDLRDYTKLTYREIYKGKKEVT